MKEILIKPLITEKMTADTERNNSYGFVVALGANKIEIKKTLLLSLFVHFVLTERQSNVTLKQVWSKAAQTLTRKH